MFEYDQKIVDSLLRGNDDFKRLHDKYTALKSRVKEANEGNIGVDDLSLEELKKEKLNLKDCMSVMIEDFKHSRP